MAEVVKEVRLGEKFYNGLNMSLMMTVEYEPGTFEK
jgi:hypothetical protein